MKRAYGYVPSPRDDRDIFFQPMGATPEEYVLENVPGPFDQGMAPICAAVTLGTITGWQQGVRGLKPNLDFFEIYDLRDDKNMEGMVPRQALSAFKKQGVDGYKIKAYARIDSVAAANTTLVGWKKEGFILQNSWGYSFGTGGRIIFPFEDWKHVMEAWTIMI